MSSPCSGCGLVTPTGADGCQEIFDQLAARALTNVAYGRTHRLVVDVYALQHPDRYMASGKSAAAHLLGVCAALEHENNPLFINLIHKWLDGPAKVAKPELPASRGASTIADIQAASNDPALYARAVRNWARATWRAYAPLHSIVRDWQRQMVG